MRIVINTSVLLTPATGVGTYVYESARALAAVGGGHDYTYYDGRFSGTLPDPSSLSGRRLARGVKKALDRFPAARGLARRVGQAFLPVIARRTRMSAPRSFDVYWEPNYIPLGLDAKRLVVTVHDLSVTTHPEWHPADRVAHYAKHFRAGLERADVIVAASEFTRRKLVDILRIDPSRIRVIYPGCDFDRFHPKLGTVPGFPERFVLAVGSPTDPRKNLARLLEAWQLLSAPLRREFTLIIAGPPPRASSSSCRASSPKPQASSPLHVGYLTRDDLAAAYSSATAVIYPSLYEGFGLPPLEAMACGCPVIASDIPPVREVCGGCAEFVDPASPESIASGLARVLESADLRREMSLSGPARAKLFTWDRTARELLQTFAPSRD